MEIFVQFQGNIAIDTKTVDGLSVVACRETFDGPDVVEQWAKLTNDSEHTVRVNRVDSVVFTVPPGNYDLMYFEGDWGNEFDSVCEPLTEGKELWNRTGRSSKRMHPWFTLFAKDGQVITGTVMWSGNWIVRFEREPDGGWRVSAGLDDWEFYKDLEPGETMESPHVAIARTNDGDLNGTSIALSRVGRSHWYPQNDAARELLVEWNHWWSYEDHSISEAVFKSNVDVAARSGFDICTLDAGWFGPSDSSTFWFDLRGDWELVNEARFPSGIRALSDYTHEKGLRFGLWCEIEALGHSSALAEQRPSFRAMHDAESLGYVCLGNPEAEEWAVHMLDTMIAKYNCDWIKLDFNLDPASGCNRSDHGHGPGDGLYAHYQGYYRVLERVRERHPKVILESCASGGLRIDLGLLRQTHTTFLSDPDWPEHNLQVFWGATTMLAPNVCLHWAYSHWVGQHPNQNFNPQDATLTKRQLDMYTRTAMLGGFGLSQKLPELPDWVLKRYEHHIRIYKEHVRSFVNEADLYRLTGQPKHDGRGARLVAFQYTKPAQQEHLLFVFRLHGDDETRAIRLKCLRAEHRYKLLWLGTDRAETYTGAQLCEEGLSCVDLQAEDSHLVWIREATD